MEQQQRGGSALEIQMTVTRRRLDAALNILRDNGWSNTDIDHANEQAELLKILEHLGRGLDAVFGDDKEAA